MESYKIYLPGSPSNRKKDLSQTSVFIPLRLLSTKISSTFQDKVGPSSHLTTFRTHPVAKIPPFLITNISTLSRNRLSVSEINLCLLYPPSVSPNPTVVPLQLSRRAFCLLRMRPSPPSFPCLPLHNLPGPLLGSLLPRKYPPTTYPPSHLSIYFHAKQITWAPHRALVRAWSPSGKHRLLRKSTLRRVCSLYAHLSLLSPTN